MIRFLLKGLFRDRHRSTLPLMVIAIGVFLTVLLHTWVTGAFGDMIDTNAKYSTGHVKIMTRAYIENIDQKPNDLAYIGSAELTEHLNATYPEMEWIHRIHFGGLLDVADENGETKEQGPAIGMAVDLLSNDSKEADRLNIRNAIVRGRLPEKAGEILISDNLARKLGVEPGEQITCMSSTMFGSMAMSNHIIAGTVEFGITVMDRGAMIWDIEDARMALDMENASGEILGYFKDNEFDEERVNLIADDFNAQYESSDDEFAPKMLTLLQQNDLGQLWALANSMSGILIFVFVIIMSIVLWNSGLIGGLRRYGEVGVRLAIGEDKGHVYRSMIWESVLIGLGGSLIGTVFALAIAYWIQSVGFDFSGGMKNSTMMIQSTFYTRVTPAAYVIGFIPGLISNVFGTMLSGFGIYKRQTASLFKELEA
ncbi:MAG: FtsX-like permease family protein [Bacteroidales bacterium]|nr:FtsX-like permease family protein [Bacteroidales bacterium]